MKKDEIIMPLSDGGILSVDYDSDSIAGCPTCDYGSMYIDDLIIRMTQYTIEVHVNTMYSHLISEGWLMRVLLGFEHDMTEMELAGLLYCKLSDLFKSKSPGRDPTAKPDYYRISDAISNEVIVEKGYVQAAGEAEKK